MKKENEYGEVNYHEMKCITFDKEAQVAIPKEVRDKMDRDREAESIGIGGKCPEQVLDLTHVPLPIKEAIVFRVHSMPNNNPPSYVIFHNAAGDEMLRLMNNGDIFVRGELATNDRQIVDGMRELLKSSNIIK